MVQAAIEEMKMFSHANTHQGFLQIFYKETVCTAMMAYGVRFTDETLVKARPRIL